MRAPGCDKMGLKKGSWAIEEDRLLVSYIQRHGHGNWRALPKKAGLERCGKSCRLRWTNYLSPDIRRGNFSEEEEVTIIKLHQMIGNRWSAIAAKLPGRTDNEIKNVWHTRLKKGLKTHPNTTCTLPLPSCDSNSSSIVRGLPVSRAESSSSSELSSVTDLTCLPKNLSEVKDELGEIFEDSYRINERFWSEELSGENCSGVQSDFCGVSDELEPQLRVSRTMTAGSPMENGDDMEFWYNLLVSAGGGLSEF